MPKKHTILFWCYSEKNSMFVARIDDIFITSKIEKGF